MPIHNKGINHGKGPEKNTKNKALHTKLLNRKKAKIQKRKKPGIAFEGLGAKMNAMKTKTRKNKKEIRDQIS